MSARMSSSSSRAPAMRRSCSTISPTARLRCFPACRLLPGARYRASPPTCATRVHCAGLKAVGESEERPLAYYDVNVGGAITLAEVMGEAGVATLVFSSSASVYGQPEDLPVTED